MKKRKLVWWGILIVLVFSLLAPAAAFAAAGEYDLEDVRKINELITRNGLQATVNDPDSWDFAVWDKTVSPYRVKELDLSNQNLRNDLSISGTQLEKLNMSGNSEVSRLALSANKLTQLNIDGMTALKDFYASANRLTEMHFTEEHENLTNVQISYNQLTQLDLSALSKLEKLICSSNNLSSLVIKDKPAFSYLDADSNELESVELTNLPNLSFLVLSSNNLISLDLSTVNPELASIALHDQAAKIDLLGTEKEGYHSKVSLKSPTFTNINGETEAALSYNGETLTSTSSLVSSTDFTTQTNHKNGVLIRGRLRINYIEGFVIEAEAQQGGSISPSGQVIVAAGEEQAFEIKAEKGYVLSQVLIDGENVPEAVANGSYTFQNITKDHTIKAVFEKLPEDNGNINTGGNTDDSNTDTGGKTAGGENSNSPKTGDSSTPILWAFILLAVSGILIVLVQKRRKAFPANDE